ncbi:MAG: hypothetical protein HBSAPP03_08590 [Phycisphaerae bacterium]|nr:MAG: hypothetical protein HBSAPP03_08590 [Phycisphaerae bacterium]
MRILGYSIVAVMLASGSAGAAVTYTDGTFTPSNWGFELVTLAAGGTSSATQVAGGNPGMARQLTNSVNGGGTVWGVSRYGTTNATRYEPMTTGAILSVDFAIDYRFVQGAGGDGHALVLAAKQGTAVFGAAYTVTGSSGAWGTYAITGVTAADFTRLDGAAGGIDFSATGAPIRFGFAVGNSSTGTPYSNTVMYDNFEVVVHNVPAPGVGLLAGAGLLTLARRRR